MNRPGDNSPTDLLSKDSRAKVAGDPGYMDKLIHVGTEMTDLLGKKLSYQGSKHNSCFKHLIDVLD